MKIKKLSISRLPGLPEGLKDVGKLASHINIITGSNGSGKSSTARAIHKLIWWDSKTTRHEISALLDVGGEQNEIQIDAQGYTRTNSRKKMNDDFSFVCPPEFSSQYMLALHDLINSDDNNLAGLIAKEINGGIDLGKATATLGYKAGTPNIAQPRYKVYREASNHLARLEKEQTRLLNSEKMLLALEEEKRLAEEASGYKDLYNRVLNVLNARFDYQASLAKLDAFSPSMSKLKEDDYETVEALDRKIAELEISIFETKRLINNNHDKIDLLHIPNHEIPSELLTEVSERIDNLRILQQAINSLEKDIDNQEVVKHRTGRVIASERELLSLREINLKEAYYLNDFIRAANEAEGIQLNLLNEKRRLEKELTEFKRADIGSHPVEDIRKGISILSDWLKGVSTRQNTSFRFMFFVILWAIITALLSYYGGSAGLIVSGAVSVLLLPVLYFVQRRSNHQQTHELGIRIADFKKCGLTTPVRWDSHSVTLRLQELLADLEISLHKAKIEEEYQKICSDIEQSQIRLTDIKAEYFRIREKLGVIPDDMDVLTNNYNSFYLFLSNLSKWQEADIELEKLKHEKQNCYDEFFSELDAINFIFGQFNFSTADTLVQVTAIFKALQKECEIKKELLNDNASLQNSIAQKDGEIEKYRLNLQEIYTRLIIPHGNKNDIYLLNSDYPTYHTIKKEVEDTLAMVHANENLLISHPLYEVYKESGEEISVEEVKEKIAAYEYKSGRQSDIIQRISEIKAQIKGRESKDDIEKALSRKEEALTDLGELLKSNLKSITGDLIVSHLHEEVSLNNDNPVLKQANSILGSITKERYKLVLGEGRQPSFRAFDNLLNHTLSLDELSTGTRVQVLLAVRLAYIETQENNIKLPILADELLANSDDERSEAIIQSLIEISRNRQVFYFTAQADEVRKWKEHLSAESDIDWQVTYLVEN